MCKFLQIEGSGILFDGLTQMTAENLGFLGLNIAGVIISSLTATISGSSVIGLGYSGIEVLSGGTLRSIC
jgi:hypothetical protein